MGEMLRVISLGAGVQSTTMALMAAHGEIGPMPDCAIFADTGWEPAHVYEHLRWLMSGNVLPFPVHVVSKGNIRDDMLASAASWQSLPPEDKVIGSGKVGGVRVANAPFFTVGKDGNHGFLVRKCTKEYKIEPLTRKVRELIGLKPRQRAPKEPRVEQWIGISQDEMQRMKDAAEPYIKHRWPLIEQRMNRQDCLQWMERNGYPRPPKSSCIGCPFHSDTQWREIRDQTPDEWADAVAVDKAVRNGVRGTRDTLYLHSQRVPLDEADLKTAADRGQIEFGFLQECDGMCGV